VFANRLFVRVSYLVSFLDCFTQFDERESKLCQPVAHFVPKIGGLSNLHGRVYIRHGMPPLQGSAVHARGLSYDFRPRFPASIAAERG
jgi:hypothetical protein